MNGETVVREHSFINGVCQHCQDKEADVTADPNGRACVGRPQPRPYPPSVFNDLPSIGERMKEIQREEKRGD